MDENALNSPLWYAVYTKPREELRAAANLRAWNVEAFTPMLRERDYDRDHRKGVKDKVLFPCYIFAHFDVRGMLHKVNYTRGVLRVVNFGGEPTPVEDEIIQLIKSRLGRDGYVRMDEELKPGDRLVIGSGALKGFTGVFERQLKDSDRVSLLLSALSYQARLIVPRRGLSPQRPAGAVA